MPAKDIFHDAVKNGLLKEGWAITAYPLFIQVGDVDIYIDLAAEKLIAAERAGQQIAVEVKSFTHTSLIYAFHLIWPSVNISTIGKPCMRLHRTRFCI